MKLSKKKKKELHQNFIHLKICKYISPYIDEISLKHNVMLWPFFFGVFGVEEAMRSGHNAHFRVGGVWDLFILRW